MKKISLSKDINDDLLDSNLHNMNTPKDFTFKPNNNYQNEIFNIPKDFTFKPINNNQNESILPNIPKFTSDKNQSI